MTGRIVTFYSFKGGVGRSMALSNLAILLAKRGLSVLAVDWDLEAPGLERYFDTLRLRMNRGGLVPFLIEQKAHLEAGKRAPPDRYREHVWTVDVRSARPLTLLPSGRASHADYLRMLDQFSWSTFFERGGGGFLEDLRHAWREQFDIVLIDSRTGMSDSGGICTIQMPDILVAMFTANFQSVLGTRDVIRSVRAGRQRLAYDRMALTVLPLASRMPPSASSALTDEWISRIANELGECILDWLPKGVDPTVAFNKLKIVHDERCSFGERLAVLDQPRSEADALYTAYDRIAGLLASDFENVETLFGTRMTARAQDSPPPKTTHVSVERAQNVPAFVDRGRNAYKYDVFVSAPHTGGALEEWMLAFIAAVSKKASEMAGRTVRVWHDTQLAPGEAWEKQIETALNESILMLALLTPHYAASSFCMREWQLFENREHRRAKELILPVALTGLEEFPERFRSRQMIDARVSDFSGLHTPEAEHSIDEAARTLVGMLRGFDGSVRASDRVAVLQDQSPPERTSILIASANLTSTRGLDIEVEAQEIARAANRQSSAQRFVIHALSDASFETLQVALHDFAPSILHFAGHSSSSGVVLGDAQGRARLISPEEFSQAIMRVPTPLRLVVFSAGDSRAMAKAVADHVGAVVTFEGPLADYEAREFSAAFYSVLGDGGSVKDAFERASVGLRRAGDKDRPPRALLIVAGGVNAADLMFPEPPN